MNKSIHQKYAELLVNYCISVKKGDRILIRSTYLAEPLLQQVIKEIGIRGGIPVLKLSIRDQFKIEMDNFEEEQLKWISPLDKIAFEEFECYLAISAPFNKSSEQNVDEKKRMIRGEAMRGVKDAYFKRTASLDLRRNSCLFPTDANAQFAGMSLTEYENFVYRSCFLLENDPAAEWRRIGRLQQEVVDFLNQKENIRYRAEHLDITFSTKGRKWINSDGKTNMPSGEVYKAPVDDSVNGYIKFTHAAFYQGTIVKGIELHIENGEVKKWDAEAGKDVLDYVFKIPGARRFGEAAIGTNRNIDKVTGNILFDEKIGGTIHMAVGQAYLQCGGKNKSN
ncbi:MAG: aminopeptidase, partial [Bacteroidia bacterium]|nr:aminopeptidase [Bacteroidia bacterium]